MKKLLILAVSIFSFWACGSDDSGNTNTDDNSADIVCERPSGVSYQSNSPTSGEIFFDFATSENDITFFVEYGETGFTEGTGTVITSNDAPIPISGLDGGTSYDVFVRAQCGDVTTENSQRRTFTTSECPQPEFLSIFNITTNSAVVDWIANDLDSFLIEYGEEGFSLGNGTVEQSTSQQIELTNLDHSTTYDVYVATVCNNTTSEYSEVEQFTTLPICNTPTDLYWAKITSSSIRVGWDSNGESAFRVEYGPPGFTPGTGTQIATSQNPYRIEGLQSDATYEIYVRANCGADGFSDYSESLVVTTL